MELTSGTIENMKSHGEITKEIQGDTHGLMQVFQITHKLE